MIESELIAQLQRLHHILEEMKALLAWQRLKYAESRQRAVSAIRFNNTTKTDLTDEYSSFHSISMNMHRILDDNNAKITRTYRERINSQLTKIECQAYCLGSPIRIY